MKSKIFSILFALVLVLSFSLVTAVPVAAADATVILGGSIAPLCNAQGSAEQYLSKGSWQAIPNTKMELYIDPTSAPYNSLGSFTIAQIASISYVTKNSGTPANVDFGLNIYTMPYTGGGSTWYGNRLSAEPLYSNNYNAPVNQWNTWSTGSGTNQLTFYDSNHTVAGFYNGPTLAVLQAGALNWGSYPTSGSTNIIDYSSQTVKYIVFVTSTGENWAAFDGFLDAMTINLTTGASITIDLEGFADEVWVDDDWAGTAPGVEVQPGKFFGFNAFATIQKGIDNVADNTIIVAAGTYNEQVVIDKSLTLQGEDRETTEIKFGYGSYPSASPLTIFADGVTVSGLTIRSGPYIEPSWAIVVKGDSALLTDLHVIKEPCLSPNNPINKGAAVMVSPGVDGFTFTDSIVDSAWNGIYAPRNPGSSNVVVRNVEFTYPGQYAILLLETTSALIEDNVFHCNAGTADSYGVIVSAVDNAEIRGNDFAGSGPANMGLLLQKYAGTLGSVTVEENDISGFAIGVLLEDGLALLPKAVLTVGDNAFSNNSVQLQDAAEALVIEDVLADNTFDRAVVVCGSGIKVPIIFSKIQGAIDAAGSGDTVEVYPGMYDGNLIVYKEGLTIRSTDGAAQTIIDASKVDKSTYTNAQGNSINYSWAETNDPGLLRNGFDIWSDKVTIDGFTIINATFPDRYNRGIGILVGSIHTTYAGFIPWNLDEWRGIVPNPDEPTPTGVTLRNNVIDGASDGIYIWASSGNTIEYNEIRDTEPLGGAGIQVYEGGANNIIRYNTIENAVNAISICGAWPDVLLDVSNTQVVGNTITNSTVGIQFYNIAGAHVIAQGNDLQGNDTGIKVESVGSATVARAQFNNFIGNTTGVQVNTASGVFDATRNWWGAATGPHHPTLNPGVVANMGNAVSDNVDFSPWLYKTQETIVPSREPAYAQSVVLDNFGAFAWNTFSTPIFLDGSADTWAQLYNLTNLDYSAAYRFDLATQRFAGLATDSDYAINPGEGFFIKMNTAGSLPILYSTEANLIPPSRPLTLGWNLIGLASMEDLEVSAAFFSLAGDGQVVSPTGNVSPGAVVAGDTIYVGEGYWVYMLGERTLAGFTMTPVNWMP